MEFSDIKDVLTFAAFRPEPDNPTAPWSRRFPNRRSVMLNVNRGSVDWCVVGKKNRIEDSGTEPGELADVAGTLGGEWASMTDDGWVGVSLNSRFIITLEHNLSRKTGWDDTIRKNPKSILGTKFDRNKCYALTHSKETNSSLLMAADQSQVQAIEDALRSHSLRPARICCGLFALTSQLLNQVNKDPNLRSQDLLLISWCENSLFVMRQKGGQWQEVRCRASLPPRDENAVAQILKPVLKATDTNTRVIFRADRMGSDFETLFLPKLERYHVTNLTEENQLWNLLASH